MKVFKNLVFWGMLANLNSFAIANDSELNAEENKQIESGGVSFEEFKILSLDSRRCVGGFGARECNSEMFYALNNNLISKQTFDWAYDNRFYPIVSRNDRIIAVCPCS